MHNFHDTFGNFPPAALIGPDGKPWHSWRVLVLPFLEHKELYERYRFDEPWDGPNNKKLIAQMPDVFHDPVHGKKSEKGFTSYAAVVGPNAGFVKVKFSGKAENLQALQEGTSIRTFIDGCSNTVLAGSVSPKAEISWTKPEDIEMTENTPSLGGEKGFAAPYAGKAGKAGLFLFCDGRVQTIRTDVEQQDWEHLLQRNVGSPPSLDRPARNQRRVPVIEYRQTASGPTAVLTYELVTEPTQRTGAGNPANGEPAASDVKAETSENDESKTAKEQWAQSVKRGERALDRENWKIAVEAYSKAVRLNPKDGLSYFFRGWAHREIDKPEQAIADLTMAIKHAKPATVQALAYYNRALAHQELKEWKKAIADLTQAIELKPKQPTYYHVRAEIYQQLGEREKAEADRHRSQELPSSRE